MKYKVGVSRLPERGWERQETVGWLIRTIRAMDRDDRISEVVSLLPTDSTPAPMLRNEIVVQAKAAKCDYLLSVDSDMVPDLPGQGLFWPTAWEFMMGRREAEEEYRDEWYDPRDVDWPDLIRTKFPPATIAAPYCGPPPDEVVYVFRWTNREGNSPNPNFRLEMISREHAAVCSGIQEVAALPTGLILYDMRVFDILPPPWYRYEFSDTTESRKATTEDVFQTRNASMLGLPLFCAFNCWAGHYKGKVVGKPCIVTRDEVHSSLVEAVKRGIDSGDRLIVLGHEGVSKVQTSKTPGGVPPADAVKGRPPVLVQGVRPGDAGDLPQGMAARVEGPLPHLAARASPAREVHSFDPLGHEVPSEDIAALHALALRTQGGIAVEVGAWAGRSTLVLADVFSQVFAVDHWQGSDRLAKIAYQVGYKNTFRIFCQNMGARLFHTVFPCHGESLLWASVWSRPIDFLFIDASHNYTDVVDDIEQWSRHVRKGGLIVCHDYEVFDGVTRAVEGLLPGFRRAGLTLAWKEVTDDG